MLTTCDTHLCRKKKGREKLSRVFALMCNFHQCAVLFLSLFSGHLCKQPARAITYIYGLCYWQIVRTVGNPKVYHNPLGKQPCLQTSMLNKVSVLQLCKFYGPNNTP